MDAADETAFLTVAEAGRRIAGGSLSPVQLVEACLGRIARHDGVVHSHILVLAERALAQAAAASDEIRAGRRRGALHGIPFAVKDNFHVAGLPTTAASRLRLGRIANRTAAAIDRLEAQGAILLGKLNCWEYGTGTGAVHFDLPFPPARNPWNTGHYTGGSSSGSGAALAAGMASFTLGTDTGGSIRLPAAACGVLGLKPTFGLVSRAGILPNCWSFDVAGPLARSAEDLAIILQALAGHDPADPASVRMAPTDYGAGLGQGVRGLTIGVVRAGEAVAPAVRAGLERVAQHLAQAGATLVEESLPAPVKAYQDAASIINWSESHAIHERDFLERHAEMGQALRDKMMAGLGIRAVDYLRAQRQRRALASATDVLMNRCDALLMPCTASTAPPIGDADAVTAFTRQAFTTPFNVSGHPGLSIPTGFDADGLPTAAQLGGRPFGEAMLLRVAAACAGAVPEAGTRRPVLD